MGSYKDIYLKRLNRYGMDYNSRVQNQREREFENYLLKSTSRVDVEYGNETIPASFERYKQDETETLAYLLTRRVTDLPNGTLLKIPNRKGEEIPWMVYWLEEIQASGYNKYIMLRMSHYVEWVDREGKTQGSFAYLYGQQDNMLKEELLSRSRSDSVYTEPLKTSFIVMPTNEYIKKDIYLTIGEGTLKEAYRVTGYDIQSVPGVEYVTINPTYLRDETPAPSKPENDTSDDFFWLNGGVK
jgi:hypothetical protein